jgi:hypothetical protein
MSVVAHLRFSEDVLLQGLARYGRVKRARWGKVLLCVLVLTVSAVLGVVLSASVWGPVAGVVLGGAYLMMVDRVQRWGIRRRFRRSPFCGEDLAFEFGEHEVRITSPQQDVRLQWSVFTKAVRFEDGFLLMQGSSVFNWIPAAAFADPSHVSAMEAHVKANIAQYSQAN